MTGNQKYDILNPTNPVPTDAPTAKEEDTMSGAKITALYCRLSQEDERLGESLSIEHQKEILLQYAREHRFPNPTFFVDDGYSGTDFNRPGFQKMLAEIEAGHVGILLTKDLSRLGRNSAMVGLYTTYTFPQNGVRYIAINDGFDTEDQLSVGNDMAGIRNWFNEFFAKDTSRKIRAINQAKGQRGVPLTSNVPYGYVKDPVDPKHWLVDSEAAAVVKRIFGMCMEGRGPHQIAAQLTAEGVLNPTSYKQRQGLNTPGPTPEKPCYWGSGTVQMILERREYTGCTVNFRTYRNSIWDKKKRENPEEKQAVFPDTHEAIIEKAIFDRVQEIRQQRHRRTGTGVSTMFSGLVYCADCGARMNFSATGAGRTDQAFFDCSTHHNKRKGGCSGHYIRESVLSQIVLKHIQAVTGCILFHEEYFRKVLYTQRQAQSQEEIRSLRSQQSRAEKRIAELKRLFMKIYEDNAAGRLSNDRYEMLSAAYETEQKQLEAEAIQIQESLAAQEKQAESLEQFIQRIKDHAIEIDHLDGTILHELIDRIEVSAPDKSSGMRVQHVHIKYNGIGFIPIRELMEQETA